MWMQKVQFKILPFQIMSVLLVFLYPYCCSKQGGDLVFILWVSLRVVINFFITWSCLQVVIRNIYPNPIPSIFLIHKNAP